LGHWQGEIPLTKPNADRPAKGYADRLLGGLGMGGKLTRKIGLERIMAWWCLNNVAYNFPRFLCLNQKNLLRRVNSFATNDFLDTLDISDIGLLVNTTVVTAFSCLCKMPKPPIIRGAL
jgi:hypothetical protein